MQVDALVYSKCQSGWEPASSFLAPTVCSRKVKSESRSVVSDSLQLCGVYSPWNSPDQNTGVGSLSLLQGIFLTHKSNWGLLHYRRILYQLSYGEGGGYVKCLAHTVSFETHTVFWPRWILPSFVQNLPTAKWLSWDGNPGLPPKPRCAF